MKICKFADPLMNTKMKTVCRTAGIMNSVPKCRIIQNPWYMSSYTQDTDDLSAIHVFLVYAGSVQLSSAKSGQIPDIYSVQKPNARHNAVQLMQGPDAYHRCSHRNNLAQKCMKRSNF